VTQAPTAAGRAATARLQAEFERAVDAGGGPAELHLGIADRHVLVRFPDAGAADALGRAFAHLTADPGGAPALTLHAWNTASAAAIRDAVMPEDVEPAETAAASLFFEGDGYRALHQPAYDALSVLSSSGDTAWFCVPDLTALPQWEHASPFRHLLSWWLADRDCLLVHAGALGTSAGGVLLVGRGGSGKSTTALAALADGRLMYAGDDYTAVGTRDGAPFVHSLYCSGKVHRRDLHRLPHLPPAPGPADDPEKAVFYAAEPFPARTIDGFPLRAIVLPRVTERRQATAVPARPTDALAALAPSTIFQLYPPARASLARMGLLVRSVPAFVLELGTEAETSTGELVRLLEELSPA